MGWNLFGSGDVLPTVKGLQTVAALGVVALLAGCGQVAPPKGATPVHFTVLTKHGGPQSGIFAATNLDDLRALQVINRDIVLRACTRPDEGGCLGPFRTPTDSLLVGMRPMSCADNRLDTAYLEDGVLTFVISWNNTCPPGYGTAAIPDDWIVAVPLHSLPQIQLPLTLEFVNGGDQYNAGKGMVDLRPSGPGRTRTGNFTLEATPRVVKGQAEHITFTNSGLKALAVNNPWRIDIAALDDTGRVVWHQSPFDDPTTFKCLVGEGYSNTCVVGAYNVDMPTVNVPPGIYVIRPSFVIPDGSGGIMSPQKQDPPRPPFALPSLRVEVAA
jgi:hypothetical protein